MNGLERLRRLIAGPNQKVSIGAACLQRYNECVDEWNQHYTEDEWCDGPRGQACADFIHWYDEVHK